MLEKFAISVPLYGVAHTADEAYEHARRIGKCYDGVLAFLGKNLRHTTGIVNEFVAKKEFSLC